MDYEAVEQLLNTMPCLTFCKDVETGRYIACNQSFAKTVCPGKSIDDVLGLSDIDLFDARTAAVWTIETAKPMKNFGVLAAGVAPNADRNVALNILTAGHS